MHAKRKLLGFHIGNALIALSFFCTVFIYFPFIRLYFFPPKITIPENAFSITIPSINAAAQITENVDPWDEKEYKEKLKLGVAHAKDSKLPGEAGTVYLFAHSSGSPWEITRQNTAFLKLNQLKTGDLIIIRRNSKEFTFRVRESKTVTPTDIGYLLQSFEQNQLILQTCTPLGTDWMRLLVFADPL